ncbi:NADH-dependent oxidoreductase [Vagococcus sp. BWB3-3]|uniref:NADH-dependent oxidoreductase n=1 Tax=Vagococcus allomyrinae TaxID=2794353 RepID=A0A940P561_9ENTE|nr:NADH-dependent oxidoreductase [Vagococcus allomyrinae]MBP1041617.1 NADH-dependent oxidoreductase [Vagococcus allomyrinae]
MTNYQPLLTPLTLTNGAVIQNRLAMAPTSVTDATPDGTITPAILTLFERRSQVAGLLIAGAATINERGKAFESQMSIAEDKHIDGLRELAKRMKKDGGKAVLQIYHAGRQAAASHNLFGEVVAPSKNTLTNLPYEPRELSTIEILSIVKQFGEATERAIDAGFDGVEIHGANNFLIHQFFSASSNLRQDEWGGNLKKRMAFPLAVIKEVKKAATAKAKSDFIIGYRLVPEEISNDMLGYSFDEALSLIDVIADQKLDYLHLSLFTGYDSHAAHSTKPYGQAVKELVGNRAAVVIVSQITTAQEALDALNYGDLVALGRSALIEPAFAAKIEKGEADTIMTEITIESAATIGLPPNLIDLFVSGAVSLDLPGKENLTTDP